MVDAVRKMEAAATELACMASDQVRDAEQRATKAGAAEAEVRQEFGRFKREAAERIEAAVRVYADHERDTLRRLARGIPRDWHGRTFKDLFVVKTSKGDRLHEAVEPFINTVLTILAEIEQRVGKVAKEAESSADSAAEATPEENP